MAKAPPIVAGTIVRFSFQADINGRACYNVIDVSLDEFGTDRETAVRDLADKMTDVWQDNVPTTVGSWYRYHGAHWMDLDALNGITGFKTPNASKPILGQIGGSQHPPNVSVLVKKQSDARRNSRNGRMYLAPTLETECDDGGTLTGAAVSRYQTHMDSLKTGISGIGVPLGFTVAWRVVHVTGHTGDPVPGHPNGYPNAWDSSDVSSLAIDPIVATQRRRLRP
jgi:hypothetical protein